MTDLLTPRLVMHPVDVAEGVRITLRQPEEEDRWAPDFPGEGDARAVAAYLSRTASHGEQRPFGFYRITRAVDGEAIGGIGFKGTPHEGSVEIGYGLTPSARGRGYGAEALAALVNVATREGLERVVAETDRDNVASQKTLERAGFILRAVTADLCFYEAVLLTH